MTTKQLSWRERLLLAVGPGVLAGVRSGDWLRILRANLSSLQLSRLPRVCSISLLSGLNSFWAACERARYGSDIDHTAVKSPLFLLGHWRSGTTHLHNLLATDERFAYPNLYQANFPHTFLLTEKLSAPLQSFFLPRERPYDHVALRMNAPYEDEFAICAASLLSPYMSAVFPRQAQYFDRFLTLRDVTLSERDQWRRTLLLFLKKLTYKYSKPLVLKSPTHTARIRWLLEMFPDAKFVHIHRHPFDVYRSVTHMYATGVRFGLLQDGNLVDWTERAVRQYKQMYEAFFEDRRLIPNGQFHQLAFDDLKQRPIESLQQVYDSLSLPSFAVAEPHIRRYLGAVSEYKQNTFAELPASDRDYIADQWKRSFHEWGYTANEERPAT